MAYRPNPNAGESLASGNLPSDGKCLSGINTVGFRKRASFCAIALVEASQNVGFIAREYILTRRWSEPWHLWNQWVSGSEDNGRREAPHTFGDEHTVEHVIFRCHMRDCCNVLIYHATVECLRMTYKGERQGAIGVSPRQHPLHTVDFSDR